MLRELIAGLRDEFDYIILDSPPGKAMLSFNALSAADEILIPLPAERPALDGVQDLLRFIHEVVWEKYNPSLKIRGILPTMYKKTTTHSAGVVAMEPVGGSQSGFSAARTVMLASGRLTPVRPFLAFVPVVRSSVRLPRAPAAQPDRCGRWRPRFPPLSAGRSPPCGGQNQGRCPWRRSQSSENPFSAALIFSDGSVSSWKGQRTGELLAGAVPRREVVVAKHFFEVGASLTNAKSMNCCFSMSKPPLCRQEYYSIHVLFFTVASRSFLRCTMAIVRHHPLSPRYAVHGV